MKSIAVIFNVFLLILTIYALIIEKVNIKNTELYVLLLITLSIAVPIFNIAIISSFKRDRKGWISLYFQRKALEEQKKIETMNKSDSK
jgi:hypothetical protein